MVPNEVQRRAKNAQDFSFFAPIEDHPSKSKTSPSKGKSYGFAILIIVAIGGLVVAGVGVSHYCGAISTLHQVHATMMIAVGGGSSFILLIIALAIKVRNRRHLTKPIKNFTKHISIQQQRLYHKKAKESLKSTLENCNAKVAFVSVKTGCIKTYRFVGFDQLDEKIFSYELIDGIDQQMQEDGKIKDQISLYAAANKTVLSAPFNQSSPDLIHEFINQLQFSDEQLEIINNGANLGFNGLCEVLDEQTKDAVCHGYLTPKTFKQAKLVIGKLKDQSLAIEYLCVGNVPKGERNTEKVYEVLVTVPLFNSKHFNQDQFPEQQQEITYLCALYNYRAQFAQALELSQENPGKTIVVKPNASPWVPVFGKHFLMVAKGFYAAAKEYETDFKQVSNISVRFQVSKDDKTKIADFLELKAYPS
ncbi:MAG: hypothetical protein R3E91_02390 [Chlamydiales bacterium]